MKDQDFVRPFENRQRNPSTVAGPSQTTPTQLSRGLVVSPTAQSSSLLPNAFKSDVLLSNVHLVSTIQSPVIWPAEGILRQALLGSEKNLKGSDKNKTGVTGDTSLSLEQGANSTLVAISVSPQAPLFATNAPQQVIMFSELGTNQIFLASPGLSHIVPCTTGLTSVSGYGPTISNFLPEVSDPVNKPISAETTRIDLEQNAPDLLVVDDHNSFSTLNIVTSATKKADNRANQKRIKADFALVQNKAFNTQSSDNSVHIQAPHHHSETLPDLISQHHGIICANDDCGDDIVNTDSNSCNATSSHADDKDSVDDDDEDEGDGNDDDADGDDSYDQESHVSEVEHNATDGSGELGYTAHLLSQLSDTGTLPTMSSSQVSSVLSALEPAEKLSLINLGSLDSVPLSKLMKSPDKNELPLSESPASPEFVKIESNIIIPDSPKTTPVETTYESNKAVTEGYKIVMVSGNRSRKQALFKCVDCGFLTLKEDMMKSHRKKIHGLQSDHLLLNGRKPIMCVGCSNIFLTKHALQVHLIQDHGVCVTEVTSIVDTISSYTEKEETDIIPSQSALTKNYNTKKKSNGVAYIYRNKEQLLLGPSHKRVYPAASIPVNSVITTTPVQSITTLPSLELTMSSISRMISSTGLVSTTQVKHPAPLLPSPQPPRVSTAISDSLPHSLLSSPSSQSSPVCITTTSSTTITTTSTTATTSIAAAAVATTTTKTATTACSTTIVTASTSSFPVFTKIMGSPVMSQSLKKNTIPEDKSDKNEDQSMLKNEKELLDTPIEEITSLDPISQSNSVGGENQSKKRGRPRGSQPLRLVKAKYLFPEMRIDMSNGIRCGVDGCAVRLKNETNMIYHKQCHSGKPLTLFCPECSHTESHWSRLVVHLWKAHNIDIELYSCDKCGYKTNSHSKLNLHNKIHGDERPFLCDLCGKGFKTPKQLRNHKTIHKVPGINVSKTTQVLSCDICGRNVSDARNLRSHRENVHNKRKPYHCSFCGYTAASRSSLRMHNRQHTGEKPFSCDVCDYTTADHNSLRRHKMRHSGNKPYQCPHCSYACIQSTTYKAHLKNKHPGLDDGLMFSCPECTFRTLKRDNLLAHLAAHDVDRVYSDSKQQRDYPNSNNVSGTILNSSPRSVLPIDTNANSRLTHATATASLPSDNDVALQRLVKHVSSSILPTSQLEVVLSDVSPTSHQQSTLVSLGIKDDVSIARSHISSANHIPVAGLAHGELIISDSLHLEDSEADSMNGELIVPESQGR